jgi:hypothetical protein
MMMRFSSLLLLLAIPIDARLNGISRRFLQDSIAACDKLENILGFFELEKKTIACVEEHREEIQYECEEIENVSSNTVIMCTSSLDCPVYSDGTKLICMYANLGSPVTHCATLDTYKDYIASVREICD